MHYCSHESYEVTGFRLKTAPPHAQKMTCPSVKVYENAFTSIFTIANSTKCKLFYRTALYIKLDIVNTIYLHKAMYTI